MTATKRSNTRTRFLISLSINIALTESTSGIVHKKEQQQRYKTTNNNRRSNTNSNKAESYLETQHESMLKRAINERKFGASDARLLCRE
jgi:hypothetical protein